MEVTGVAAPPVCDTRRTGLFTASAKRIVPSGPQAPCEISGALQITSGIAPDGRTFFSLAPAQKPMNCESGDQKGKSAPSVCSIRCASGELKALIHKKLLPEASAAAKANIWPSGETAMCSKGCQFRCSVTPSGRPKDSRTGFVD